MTKYLTLVRPAAALSIELPTEKKKYSFSNRGKNQLGKTKEKKTKYKIQPAQEDAKASGLAKPSG